MSIGFCTLDEAWGTSMCPENTNNVQTYSSFEQQTKTNPENTVNTVNTNSQKNIDLDNVSGKKVINSNMLKQNNRNVVGIGNPNQLNDRKMNINSIDKIIDNLERRIQILENNSKGSSISSISNLFKTGNSSYDYIILIVIGVVIIYLLDKFLNKK